MKPSDLVKVKALEWGDQSHGGRFPPLLHAHMFGYDYWVSLRDNGVWRASVTMGDDDNVRCFLKSAHLTIHDAKAACQAHYESMIYELLEVR